MKGFQELGKIIDFGGLKIQLCAFPREQKPNGIIEYAGKKTQLPQGETFYPFKLGYKLIDFNPYTKIADIYKFLRWQLLYEKKVRFLDEKGQIANIKENSKWGEHYQAIIDILETGKTDLQIEVTKYLEA